MKRIISIIGFLAASAIAFAAPANVQTNGVGGDLTNGFSTGAKTITVPNGGTIDYSGTGAINAKTWVGVTPGTGVATALAVNVGTAGAPVVNGGALGTPSSGVATNLTGTAAGLTAGNATTLATYTPATLPVSTSTQAALDTLTSANQLVGHKAFGSAFPLSRSGAFISFGTSRTAGVNAAYGGFLPAEDRWINMIPALVGSSVGITNYGVGASGMRWVDTNDNAALHSHYNQLRNVEPTTEGGIFIEAGYNDVPNAPFSQAYTDRLERAYEAVLDRSLAVNWWGMTHLGWSYAANSATTGWATSVASSGNATFPADSNPINPFQCVAVSSARYWVTLGASDYVQASSLSTQVSIHTEADTTAGVYRVLVNGVQVGPNYDITGLTVDQYLPHVSSIIKVNIGDTIRVERVSGSVRFLAFSTRVASDGTVAKRTVVLGSVSDVSIYKDTASMFRLVKAAERATSRFPAHDVRFANLWNTWDQTTDSEPTDPAHLTILANKKYAAAYVNAQKIPYYPAPTFQDAMDAFSARKDTANTFSLAQTFSAPPKVPAGLGGGIEFGAIKIREYSDSFYLLNLAEDAYKGLFLGSVFANGTGSFSDGTQGLLVRSYTGGSGFGAIYPFTVTPGTDNYALAASSTSTTLNAPSGGTLEIALGGVSRIGVSSGGQTWLRGLTTNGFVKTSGGTGELSVDTTTYLSALPTSYTAVAAGTAYTLTGSFANVDFGTTDPSITISTAGNYLLTVDCSSALVGATTVAGQSVEIILRRTNNTAADLGTARSQPLPAATISTQDGPSVSISSFPYTAGAGDIVTVQACLIGTLGAGTVTIDNAHIVAVPR